MLHGFLLLDKAKGINSFKLVVALRRLANQKRVGFAGTLDPLASGLMVMALGEYTKLLPYLEAGDKTYLVEARLGQISDTYDIDGTVETVLSPGPAPERQEIEYWLRHQFSGQIMQVPPRHSAIQIAGKRAYALARAGESFELKARPVEIFNIVVRHYQYPLLRLEVHCSSGTYVRSLVHDLGQRLGCGAAVSELRRTTVGVLQMESEKTQGKIKKLEQLEAGQLKSDFVDPRLILAGKFQSELTDDEYAVLARGNFIANRWRESLERAAVGRSASAIAFWRGVPVGVMAAAGPSAARDMLNDDGRETAKNDFFAADKLKFSRKLNIF